VSTLGITAFTVPAVGLMIVTVAFGVSDGSASASVRFTLNEKIQPVMSTTAMRSGHVVGRPGS
jgi:hypothetical protein